MAISYTISLTKRPLGDPDTGVVKQVEWRMIGVDGGVLAEQSGIAELPPIDPNAPSFIPLLSITIPVLLEWAGSVLNIPFIKAQIASAIEEQIAANTLQPLSLATNVEATALAGVPAP